MKHIRKTAKKSNSRTTVAQRELNPRGSAKQQGKGFVSPSHWGEEKRFPREHFSNYNGSTDTHRFDNQGQREVRDFHIPQNETGPHDTQGMYDIEKESDKNNSSHLSPPRWEKIDQHSGQHHSGDHQERENRNFGPSNDNLGQSWNRTQHSGERGEQYRFNENHRDAGYGQNNSYSFQEQNQRNRGDNMQKNHQGDRKNMGAHPGHHENFTHPHGESHATGKQGSHCNSQNCTDGACRSNSQGKKHTKQTKK